MWAQIMGRPVFRKVLHKQNLIPLVQNLYHINKVIPMVYIQETFIQVFKICHSVFIASRFSLSKVFRNISLSRKLDFVCIIIFLDQNH